MHKEKTRNPSLNSSTADDMADLGHFASSSSLSSSNLSPLAPPFTVERSNRSKLSPIVDLDSNFNLKSDGILPNFHSPKGLSADSITHNWSSNKLGLEPINQAAAQLFDANSTYTNPINPPTTHNWSSHPKPTNSPSTHNWSSHPNPTNSPSTHNSSSHPNPTNSPSTHNWSSHPNPTNSPSTHNWSSHPNPTNSPSTHNWSSHPNPTNSPSTHNWSSHPNPTSSPSTHNWSSMNSSIKSGLEPINQAAGPLFGVNFAYPNPNSSASSHNWSSHPNPINSPNTHNWSSMNSSIKSGLEPVNQPVGHLFDVNPNLQPTMWNLGNDDREDDAPLMPLNFDLLPNSSLFSDYGSSSSQVGFSQSLFGSKYSAQADRSRGKEDSMVGPSIIGKSHDTSFSATNHGHFSSGFPKENTITSNDHTSHYPFEARPIMYDSFRDHISPSITKSPPSIVIKPSVPPSPFPAQTAVNHNPLKEKDFEAEKICLTSNLPSFETNVSNKMSNDGGSNFDFKASRNFHVPDINTSEDVKSAANFSEQLDHHNSAEDSPCWKGAPNQLLSSGSWYTEPELSYGKADHHYLHLSVNNPRDLARADSLDVTNTLRILISFSEFLLLHCSMGEIALKEPEYMALDHVIATLNGCKSKRIQVDAAENDQERKNDNFGKIIEELQSVTLKDDDLTIKKVDDLHLPKDYNMIQEMKKVLEENLECKEENIRSDTLLYKNLWLETEAELCALNYKARFNRVKREMEKSKASVPDASEIASEIKKTSSSTFSPIAPKLISKTSNTHSQNPSSLSVDDKIDDVGNSVMARFNILKLRAESNLVNMTEKEPADVEEAYGDKTQTSGVSKDDAVVMHSQKTLTEDVDRLVMARFNILKSRGEQVSGKESQSCVGPHFQHQAGKEEEVGSGSGGSTSVMHSWFASGSGPGLDTNSNYGASSDWEYVMDK